MVMDTALTRMMSIEVPVVCAPMAGVADSALALAVSRAGGLGCIGVGSAATCDWLAAQLADVTDGAVPFGVGFMGWALARDDAAFAMALSAKPDLVSLAFVDPIDELTPWVERAKAAGAAVAIQVGTAPEAAVAERIGADIVVARGGEAGGHGRNAVATLPLLQEVLDTVSAPVLAAGGIATARGLAAVLAAGAAGAWVGTAFTGCAEATSSVAAREAMDRAAATDTLHTRVFDIAQRLPWPEPFGGRALGNGFTETWAQRPALLQTLVDSQDRDPGVTITADMRAARAAADTEMAPVYCGQGVGMIRTGLPAAEIIAEFARAGSLLAAAGVVAGAVAARQSDPGALTAEGPAQ